MTLSTAAMITFFYSLGEHGLQTALLYYLKAQFGYSKDEFANLMLIAGAAGMISQLTVMPIFAPIVGEEMLLIVGLLGGCTHVFLYGIAWSYWVPYFAAAFIILSAFVHPSVSHILLTFSLSLPSKKFKRNLMILSTSVDKDQCVKKCWIK
uniref:Major facilitator superfamily (MFS) profile domain-containing protein n=1 Tax=Aegilops tauschii subsp. strangulata TaxID=200361 RepID=A0A453P8W9_AEGTS